MKKVAAVVVALGVGVSSSTFAHAATLLVHMLGPSTPIGTLCDVDAREGTNIDFTALPAAVPPTFPGGEGCAWFFRRSTGRARVSGAVQIAESVFFDCFWKIERDPKRGAD